MCPALYLSPQLKPCNTTQIEISSIIKRPIKTEGKFLLTSNCRRKITKIKFWEVQLIGVIEFLNAYFTWV